MGKAHHRPMPHLLELFSGTQSVGQIFRQAGWDVTSIDNDPRTRPTFVADIGRIDLEQLPPDVDMIWASPPCTQYSVARTTAKTPRDLAGADALVRATLEIIDRYPEA